VKRGSPPEKEKALAGSQGPETRKNPPEVATGNGNAQGRKLPLGKYPGFKNLKSQPGVYRCKLHYQANKTDPGHADYKGILHLTGSKASVLIWCHSDGSLGLRLEKIEDRRKGRLGGGVAK
jgi:hypothetical protein